MTAKLDDVRRNLAQDFNALIEAMTNFDASESQLTWQNTEHWEEMLEAAQGMRNMLAVLLCMYDPNNSDDCNSLADVKLLPIPNAVE